MRKRHLAATAAAVLTATAAGIVLTAVDGAAAPPVATLGTLTASPATGVDVQAPTYTTTAGCSADSDGYNMYLYGPGGFANGLIATTPSDVGFSTTAPFSVLQGLSFKDIAVDNLTTITAGTYTVVVNCIDTFGGDVKGTFTRELFFTDATHYQSTDPSAPTTTTTVPTTTTTVPSTTTEPTTTEPTATTTDPTTTTTEPTTTTTEPTTTTTEPTTTTTEPTTTTAEPTTTTTEPTTTTTEPTVTTEPTTTTTEPSTTTTVPPSTTTVPTTTTPPAAFGLTPATTSGKDVEAPLYTTSAGCGDNSADSYNLYVRGPGVFANGLIATVPTDVGFSKSAPFTVKQGLSFKDLAVDAGALAVPTGDYTVEVNCIEAFPGDTAYRTFTVGLRFTSPTDWQVTGGGTPTTTTTPPTTTSVTTTATTTGDPTTTDPADTSVTDPTDTTDPITATSTPDGSAVVVGVGVGDGQGTGGLASTGASIGLALLLGTGLLGAGAFALVAARRRRAGTGLPETSTES